MTTPASGGSSASLTLRSLAQWLATRTGGTTFELSDLAAKFPGTTSSPSPFPHAASLLGSDATGFSFTQRLLPTTAPTSTSTGWLVVELTCTAYNQSGSQCLASFYFDPADAATVDMYLLLSPPGSTPFKPTNKAHDLLHDLLGDLGWQGSDFVLLTNQPWSFRYGEWQAKVESALPPSDSPRGFFTDYAAWKPTFGLSHHGKWTAASAQSKLGAIGHLLPEKATKWTPRISVAQSPAASAGTGTMIPASVSVQWNQASSFTRNLGTTGVSVTIKGLSLGFTLFKGGSGLDHATIELGGTITVAKGSQSLEFDFDAIVPLASGEDVSLSGELAADVDLATMELLVGETIDLTKFGASLPSHVTFSGGISLSISKTSPYIPAFALEATIVPTLALFPLPLPNDVIDITALTLSVEKFGILSVTLSVDGKLGKLPSGIIVPGGTDPRFPFRAAVSYPDESFSAGLEPGTEVKVSDLARDVGLPLAPGSIADSELGKFAITDLQLDGSLTQKSLSFEVTVDTTQAWPIPGVFEFDELTVFLLLSKPASGSGELSVLVGGVFTVGDLLLFDAAVELDATITAVELDASKTASLEMRAQAALESPIPIEDIVDALAEKLGSPPPPIPGVIQGVTTIAHVGASVEGTLSGDAAGASAAGSVTFDCGGSLTVDSETVELLVRVTATAKTSHTSSGDTSGGHSSGGHSSTSSWDYSFEGTVTVMGRAFTFDLHAQSGQDLFLLAVYSSKHGDKIWLHNLLSAFHDQRAGATSLAAALPLDLEIVLREALIAVALETGSGPSKKLEGSSGSSGSKPSAAQRQLLAGLFLDVPLDFKSFPLVGKFLEGSGFHNLQMLAATGDVPTAVIDQMNTTLASNTPPGKPMVVPPGQSAGLAEGFSLTGSLDLGTLKLPLQLHFGGKSKRSAGGHHPSDSVGHHSLDSGASPPAPPTFPVAPSTFPPSASGQRPVGKKLGPINFRKVGLTCSGGDVGLVITGGLSLAAFEFELLGLEIAVPQAALEDPSQLEHIHFGLRGFSADIHKGTLIIAGGFLHEKVPAHGTTAAYEAYDGFIQVAFPPFAFTGLGSYAKFEGHTSLLLFVALGFPISINPSLVFTGMSLGFGIHRNFIPPKISGIEQYPLVAAAVTPPVPIDITTFAREMNEYLPPMLDEYFVVAGVKFRAFGLIDSLVMLAVKFGRQLEIDLLGVSSVFLAATFIELEWEVRFVPAEGTLLMAGQLTNRSYIMEPTAHLTGGFAVEAWMKGNHQGEFVVTVGGYSPTFKAPAYYPSRVPRLGILFSLDGLVVKGGVYFAVTPRMLMLGGAIDASMHLGPVTGYLRMAVDFLINYQPFHFDARISIDAGVKVDIHVVFFTYHINVHLHAGMHVWGPPFSGVVELDLHVKTIRVAFGKAASAKALPVPWDKFKGKFLPKGEVCSMAVTAGLIRKVKAKAPTAPSSAPELEYHIVDPRHLVLEAKSTMPFTASSALTSSGSSSPYQPGITPMDLKTYSASFETSLTPEHSSSDDPGGSSKFDSAPITSRVPAAIWGSKGLNATSPGPAGGVEPDALSGVRLTVKPPTAKGKHALERASALFETDTARVPDDDVAEQINVQSGAAPAELGPPIDAFGDWTGLESGIPAFSARELLTRPRPIKLLSTP